MKQGWEPLCKFLEIDDIPTEPFPFLNERAELARFSLMINRICDFVNVALVGACLGVVGYVGYKYYKPTSMK